VQVPKIEISSRIVTLTHTADCISAFCLLTQRREILCRDRQAAPCIRQYTARSHIASPMSESATSSNFQLIIDALAEYASQTGIDLAKHPFVDQIQNCDSANAIFQLIQDKANQFRAFWDENCKLIDSLDPVVQFLHAISGTLGKALVLVSPPNHTIISPYNFMLPLTGTVSTCKSNICRR
jgi:fungal STAND N-terminal Goodbye domain